MMRYKASFISGLAAGYVLGTRAGRERYEQLRRAARSAMDNQQVQHAATAVHDQAGQFVGTAMRAAADKSKAMGQRVGERLPSRISDRLPSGLGGHPAAAEPEPWQPYAHAGTNGTPPAPTAGPGTSGTTGTD
jgi:hypothetical protein